MPDDKMFKKLMKCGKILPPEVIKEVFGDFSEGFGNFFTGGIGLKKFQHKNLDLIEKAKSIISEYDQPLTVRQIYYRLVAGQIIDNNLKSYKRICKILGDARKCGLVLFDDIVDRTRVPIKSSSWNGLKSFLDTVKKAYRREKWLKQENWVEVWLEKDALSGVFEPITDKYDVYLVIGRGYPSLSALNDAARRFPEDKPTTILYFGDFDPTGEDIPRSIKSNLSECFGKRVNLERIAITSADVEEYNLPPAPTKRSDPRSSGFVQKHGDVAVELDALPPDVLQEKIESSIKRHIDIEQFEQDVKLEEKERIRLRKLIKNC